MPVTEEGDIMSEDLPEKKPPTEFTKHNLYNKKLPEYLLDIETSPNNKKILPDNIVEWLSRVSNSSTEQSAVESPAARYRPDSIYHHVRKWIKDIIYFDAQVDEIMIEVLADADPEMADRWNHSTNNYPESFLNIVMLYANRSVVKWIDAKMPLHWARPMFDGTAAKLVAEQKSENT